MPTALSTLVPQGLLSALNLDNCMSAVGR